MSLVRPFELYNNQMIRRFVKFLTRKMEVGNTKLKKCIVYSI